MTFESYLNEQNQKKNTISQHSRYVSYFLCFVAENSLTLEQLTYSDILDFVDQLKEEGKTINNINRILLALRYYFAYLQKESRMTHNPTAGLKLKGTIRSVPHDLLTKEELETLYNDYLIKDERTHRNKVLLGLLIYQALTREELERLRPEHLKLREGKIQIPQTGRTNGRILNLEPHQILDLQEYLQRIRPKIVATERLFSSMEGKDLKNSLLHLNHALRKLNPKLKNAVQIRQSVIAE